MKSIITKINEAYKDAEFTVLFNGLKNKDGEPLPVKILVDPRYKQALRQYLESEKGNSVFMATDWRGDSIGEE